MDVHGADRTLEVRDIVDHMLLVHEFSHAIHGAIRRVNPELAEAIQAAYEDAKEAEGFGRHHAADTVAAYWAESNQWWF